MLDAADVATILHAQFPDVMPGEVRHLGEGYDSVVFDVDGRLVFRFPKRAEVEEQLLLEMRVLPVLRSTAPLELPDMQLVGRPSALFPRHFCGYPRIAGVPGVGGERIAPMLLRSAVRIGEFLTWLHGVNAAEMLALGVPRFAGDELLAEMQADALAEFTSVITVAPPGPLARWRRYLERAPAAADTGVFVHGDLAAEHILYDTEAGSVTGVIDWSEMAVADPALDLAALYHCGGPDLADAVLQHYGADCNEGVQTRARYLAACRGVLDVTFGLESGRREYVDGGVRALSLCVPGNGC